MKDCIYLWGDNAVEVGSSLPTTLLINKGNNEYDNCSDTAALAEAMFNENLHTDTWI